MKVLDIFEVKKDRNDFCIFELIERDEYTKTMPSKKTGKRIKEWKDIECYHTTLKGAFSRVAELAIERGFEKCADLEEFSIMIKTLKKRIEKEFVFG